MTFRRCVLWSVALSLLVATQCTGAPKTKPRVQRRPILVHFDAKKYKGGTGTVTLPGKHAAVCVYLQQATGDKQNKIIIASGKDGVITAPAGSFSLLGYLMSPAGKSKPVYGSYSQGMTRKIVIPRGGSVELAVGSPIQASVTVKQKPDSEITIDLKMTGRDGERCTIYDKKPPSFQILSKAGKVLQEGKFKYG